MTKLTEDLADWDGARPDDDYIKPLEERPTAEDKQKHALAREVEKRLNAIADPPIPDTDAEFVDWLNSDGPAIRDAKHGNIEPLRQRHPRLATFLHAKKVDRRKHITSKVKTNPVLKAAAADVPRIEAILAEMFEGKRNPSAREVAAAIWCVSLDRLNKHMNKPGRSTKPRKRKVAKS